MRIVENYPVPEEKVAKVARFSYQHFLPATISAYNSQKRWGKSCSFYFISIVTEFAWYWFFSYLFTILSTLLNLLLLPRKVCLIFQLMFFHMNAFDFLFVLIISILSCSFCSNVFRDFNFWCLWIMVKWRLQRIRNTRL